MQITKTAHPIWMCFYLYKKERDNTKTGKFHVGDHDGTIHQGVLPQLKEIKEEQNETSNNKKYWQRK